MTGYGVYAKTVNGMIVSVPLDVRDNQRLYATNDRSFTVVRPDGRTGRAKLAPELYGLFTTGTGDMIVRMI